LGITPFSPAERSVKSACCAFSVNTQLGSAQIIAYEELLAALAQTGASWVQIDDPILVLDLPAKWQHAFRAVYHRLQRSSLKILLASYFGALGENLSRLFI